MPTWWQDDCACPVLDTSGDGCGLPTDTDEPTHLCRHCKAHAAELDRLRRIEAAARRIADDHRQGYEPSIGAMGELFRALRPEGSGTRCPSCDSGKREHRGFAVGDDPVFRCEDDWHVAEGSARDGG